MNCVTGHWSGSAEQEGMHMEKINPSVKAITVLVGAILLSFQYLITLNTIVFLTSMVLLIFFSKARLRQILLILIPALIVAFGMFMMGLYYARGSSITFEEISAISSDPYAIRAAMSHNLQTALQLATRLLAYAGVGILFALTTDGEEFISSLMHQCRLSPQFAYGVLAAVHLLPAMQREYKSVRTAYAVRNVRAGFLSIHPIFTMMVNCVRWSESVAMAMESKGFDGKAPRTYYTVPRVRWYDIVFAAVFLCGIILGMIFLKY